MRTVSLPDVTCPTTKKDSSRVEPLIGCEGQDLPRSDNELMPIAAERTYEHADDCDLVLLGAASRDDGTLEWVEANANYEGDEMFCTCELLERMARFAVYGDERLVADLPFPARTVREPRTSVRGRSNR